VRARGDRPFKNCAHLRALQQSFKEHRWMLLKRQTLNNLLKEDIQRDTCHTDDSRLVSKLLRLKLCLSQTSRNARIIWASLNIRIWYYNGNGNIWMCVMQRIWSYEFVALSRSFLNSSLQWETSRTNR
jgi:hypothetical protein